MTHKEMLLVLVDSHLGYGPAKKTARENIGEIETALWNALDDLEWLKSKLNLAFAESLPNECDRTRVLSIMKGERNAVE